VLGGLAADAVDDLQVAAVQAVEVPHCHHGLAPIGRAGIVRVVRDGTWQGGHGMIILISELTCIDAANPGSDDRTTLRGLDRVPVQARGDLY
jgi:hypothetical protein